MSSAMPFLKVNNVILNTDQIAAIELNRTSWTGKSCVVVHLAGQRGWFGWEPQPPSPLSTMTFPEQPELPIP